ATTSKLRELLKEKLPEYMIPAAFVVLDSLPLTPNGKLDRLALTALDTATSRSIDKIFIAPGTPTELTLAKIWAEVLNIERVGIYDNFFDLGGNSLLTLRLIEQIHKQFERDLPLSSIFLNPTIESLANSLCQETDSLSWSPLVTIQPAGSNPPFFCVHPIFGVVFPYYELAHHLGTNQPFYGLQPIGIDGQTPLTSIEEMAAHYIEALRKVQPKGPYYLGGWSFGGLVAFEMAQQLEKSGDEVALLAMLDTLAPIQSNIPDFGNGLKFLFTTVARYIWSFFFDYFRLITAPSKNKIQSLIFRLPNFHKFLQSLEKNLFSHFILGEAAIAKSMPDESRLRILKELTIRPMLRVFYANNQAVLNYVPQVYPKRITLLKTSLQSSIAEQDSSMGWNQLAVGGTEIYPIPGNHLTMLRKPHIQVVAQQLKACIEKGHL
ncbi:MAG: non-ribosomal peptide synthetase, partial [Tolypothrix sp. Co-bin9]|nr:non-ribosomal peptide synthetase [Tolypothrix sp. Co-bin9]